MPRNLRITDVETLAVGQFVRIKRGFLKGLSGTLVSMRRDGNCLVELDGMRSGVLLSIASTGVSGTLEQAPGCEPGCE
jgi:hypothetical protein